MIQDVGWAEASTCKPAMLDDRRSRVSARQESDKAACRPRSPVERQLAARQDNGWSQQDGRHVRPKIAQGRHCCADRAKLDFICAWVFPAG